MSTPLSSSPRRLSASTGWPAVGLLVVVVSVGLGLQFSSADVIWYPRGTPLGLGFADLLEVSRSGWSDFAALIQVAAIGAAALVYRLASAAGSGVVPATAAALAMAFSGLFWSRAAAGHGETVATFLVVLTLAWLRWWGSNRRWPAFGLLCLCCGLLVFLQPWTAFALPALALAAAWPLGWRTVRLGGVSLALGGAVGLAILAQGLAGNGLDGSTSSNGIDIGAAADLHPLEVLRLTVTDLGLLGVAFLAAGLARLALERNWWQGSVAGWTLALVLARLVFSAAPWPSGFGTALAPIWLLVASGMEWTRRPAPGRTVTWIVTAVVLLLPVMQAVSNHRQAGRARAGRAFVDRYFEGLGRDPSGGSVIFTRAGAQGALDVARRVGLSTAPVAATANAVPSVQLLGFRLRSLGGVKVSFEELLSTIPNGWIVGVATGRQFLAALHPRDQPTFGVLGGTVDLFGERRTRYGLIGVKGRAGRSVERTDVEAVGLRIGVGDPLGRTTRMPASLRLSSASDGLFAEYQGRRVAASPEGIVIVVLTPSGELAGAYGADAVQEASFAVDPAPLSLALSTGREPCVAVQGDRWSDASGPASLDSLATVLDSGQKIVVYLGHDQPLSTRPTPVPHSEVVFLEQRTFERSDPDTWRALDEALRSDDIDRDAGALRWPYVYRLEATPPGEAPAEMALRLGGFASFALARLTSGEAGEPVPLCAAMLGREGLLAGGVVGAFPENELSAELEWPFVSGWEARERGGPLRFRWTTAPAAALLVPVARPQAALLEIELMPARPDGATLRVRINETDLEPVTVVDGWHTYRLQTPPEAWRPGLNRVWIGTPQMVRPSDIGPSRDRRLLGIAVSRVRLVASAGGP